nr:hypothetical protein [Desulfovibrio sp. Fe33]
MDVRRTDAPRLLVSGAWEFLRPTGDPEPGQTLAALNEAFNVMRYDVGLLSAREAEALRKDDVPLPSWRKSAEQEAFTVVTIQDGRKIGFLRFPSLPNGTDDEVPQDLVTRLSKQIRENRSKVDLLIALTDWGWVAENAYLKSNPEYVPDMLFGSGNGSGINGRVLADGRCLWVRPYDKGRSISEVNVLQWPKRENSFAWDEAKNYTSASVGMNDAIKDNPDINALFE